jgi:hypothetical protein
MAYQLYQLFPRNIARHIHYSINPTPAQRRARDLEAHKKEYYLPLETISEMGEYYRMDLFDMDELYMGDLEPEDFEGVSFIAWWWNPEFHQERGVYGATMRQYLARNCV